MLKTRPIRRRLATAVVAGAAAAMLAASPAVALPAVAERLSGDDRYATSAAISERFFPGESGGVVYVASGRNYPDALAGAAAAGKENASLLLVSDSISDAVAEELQRLDPAKIVVLGGKDAVSNTVAGQLTEYAVATTRLSGLDRYSTAVEISEDRFANGAGTVFIASGTSFADALAGAPAAGASDSPVLLVPRDQLPGSVSAEIKRLQAKRIVVLGGEDAVSADVVGALAGLGGAEVERVAGSDRFATSAAIAEKYFVEAGSAVPTAFFASGENFPDALSIAAPAAIESGPVLLVRRESVDESVVKALAEINPAAVVIAGGEDVISDEVVEQLLETAPIGSAVAETE